MNLETERPSYSITEIKEFQALIQRITAAMGKQTIPAPTVDSFDGNMMYDTKGTLQDFGRWPGRP